MVGLKQCPDTGSHTNAYRSSVAATPAFVRFASMETRMQQHRFGSEVACLNTDASKCEIEHELAMEATEAHSVR
jgi:hypothetical protein